MRRKTKRNVIQSPEVDPLTIKEMIGKTKWFYLEEKEACFPVKVESIELVDCALKATVKPVNGAGEFSICITELREKKDAEAYLELLVKDEMAQSIFDDVCKYDFLRERRAAFVRFVQKNFTGEDGSNLNMASDHTIRSVMAKTARKLAELPEGYQKYF